MSVPQLVARLVAGLALATAPMVMASTTHAQSSPETMTLTAEGGGEARLGSHVTVAFKDGITIEGDYFDFWVCDDTSVQPIQGGQNGTCEALTFWARDSVDDYDQQSTARTMSFLMSSESLPPALVSPGGVPYKNGLTDAVLEAPPGGWCAFKGKYMIAHDLDSDARAQGDPAGVVQGFSTDLNSTSGGHSNFLRIAADCEVAATTTTTAAPATTAAALPETGMGTTSGLIGVITLLAGAVVISVRRLRTA